MRFGSGIDCDVTTALVFVVLLDFIVLVCVVLVLVFVVLVLTVLLAFVVLPVFAVHMVLSFLFSSLSSAFYLLSLSG